MVVPNNITTVLALFRIYMYRTTYISAFMDLFFPFRYLANVQGFIVQGLSKD